MKNAKEFFDYAPIPLHELIAAPVIASGIADYELAKQTVKFIFDFGFENGSLEVNNDKENIFAGILRMVSFSYDTVINYEKVTKTIRIPLLSLIPIPGLKITNAEFQFNIQMSHTENADSADAVKLASENLFRNHQDSGSYRFLGKMAGRSGFNDSGHVPISQESNMNIKLNIKEMDLPSGIIKMINLINDNISSQEIINNNNKQKETL